EPGIFFAQTFPATRTMNRDEAKTILQLYRPGTVDAKEPQMVEALALAKNDAELAGWLAEHCTQHKVLRAKFRSIAPPPGLKEQIISERAAQMNLARKRQTLAFAALAVLLVLIGLAAFWWRPQPAANTFAHYCNRMIGTALRGYSMDLETNRLDQIRNYLAGHQAPADYQLPDPLQKTATVGCGVLEWQGSKVSMVCFRTGKPLMPGEQSDLWLFVADRKTVEGAPATTSPHFAKVNRLITASWIQGDKLYLLATEGDAQTIQNYL
ncbi:MAG TPA: hypothetical protein VKA67_07270, partial [Verrucomicrobiae bacterium]|nr:hypothetical protein [Verrucomicrobiae bacterium]